MKLSGMKGMKYVWRQWLLGAILACGFGAAAQAETLFYSTTLVTAANMNVANLELDSPGKLTVTLKDVDFPDLLNTLSFALSDGSNLLGQESGNGSWTFDIQTPGTLFATIYAVPTAAAKAGVYFAHITYEALSAAPAPVPLPAALWLLLSGLTGFAALRPKQKLSQISA